ncbi:uncharacterized protein LOC117644074 [Thrips palmi]|uniref:Uncharacterized protein LOC117644074 n=1 Tax=Thrips palmi TaxID=161013 RepID=A0A6P8YQD0_THRPL|nr:uncharacterized protein LOC117644074 [Thrips palmi]
MGHAIQASTVDLEDCPLTRLLLDWQRFLQRKSSSAVLRFIVHLPSTKMGFYMTIVSWVVCGPIEVAATVATGASLTEAMVGIQWTTGTYSGIMCGYRMLRSRLLLSAVLADLAKCTHFLEKSGGAAMKDKLQRTARRKQRLGYFYLVYGVSTVFGVIATFATMRPHWAEAMVGIVTQGFATKAYSGPWLDEGAAERRVRLQMMQASTVRTIQFHGRGVGVFNRRACNNALRLWFRFLQGVLNLNARS